ncbi:MAG: hypothetical protein ACREKL_01290 [Chthoniobacterales bacterium]
MIPLRSGFAEVRKALGKPVREVDLANYSKPYPGDAKAVQPLLEYEFGRDWTLYVYFVFPSNDKLPGGFAGKVRSFELVPKNPIRFPKPSADIFRRSEVIAADAGWNDFADGSGLRYEIYRSRIPSGRRKADDLNRIVYGPSDAELARWKKE